MEKNLLKIAKTTKQSYCAKFVLIYCNDNMQHYDRHAIKPPNHMIHWKTRELFKCGLQSCKHHNTHIAYLQFTFFFFYLFLYKYDNKNIWYCAVVKTTETRNTNSTNGSCCFHLC